MKNTGSIFKKSSVGLVLGVLIVVLWVLSIAPKEAFFEIVAYVVGGLMTLAFVWFFALIALDLRSTPVSSTHGVITTLLSVLRSEKNAKVRAKAVKELALLDLEQSILHHKHDDLDHALVGALKDEDPTVRSEAVEGLANLELEEFAYHHDHIDVDDIIFEHNV